MTNEKNRKEKKKKKGNVQCNVCFRSKWMTLFLTGLPTEHQYIATLLHYENMTLKITLKSPTTLKTSETTLKSFTKDNHTEIFNLITLKSVCYCYLTTDIVF